MSLAKRERGYDQDTSGLGLGVQVIAGEKVLISVNVKPAFGAFAAHRAHGSSSGGSSSLPTNEGTHIRTHNTQSNRGPASQLLIDTAEARHKV